MSGYFSKTPCKGKRNPDIRCKSYKGNSPSGTTNGNLIDNSGYCINCRRTLGIADGQQSLSLV